MQIRLVNCKLTLIDNDRVHFRFCSQLCPPNAFKKEPHLEAAASCFSNFVSNLYISQQCASAICRRQGSSKSTKKKTTTTGNSSRVITRMMAKVAKLPEVESKNALEYFDKALKLQNTGESSPSTQNNYQKYVSLQAWLVHNEDLTAPSSVQIAAKAVQLCRESGWSCNNPFSAICSTEEWISKRRCTQWGRRRLKCIQRWFQAARTSSPPFSEPTCKSFPGSLVYVGTHSLKHHSDAFIKTIKIHVSIELLADICAWWCKDIFWGS